MAHDQGALDIPPPDPNKPPLQANIFHALRSANTALVPLFPYVGDGDLVPGATIMWGGPGKEMSAFNHTNTVDEVAICFAADNSRLRAGFVHVGSRTHIVGNFFEDDTDPRNLTAIVVTQRQAEKGVPQEESLTFFCRACQNTLMYHRFSSKNDGDAAEADVPGYQPPLETLTEGAICLYPFNADEAARTCSKCGTVNDPFPLSNWGWDYYEKNLVAAEKSRRQLLARTADPVA